MRPCVTLSNSNNVHTDLFDLDMYYQLDVLCGQSRLVNNGNEGVTSHFSKLKNLSPNNRYSLASYTGYWVYQCGRVNKNINIKRIINLATLVPILDSIVDRIHEKSFDQIKLF